MTSRECSACTSPLGMEWWRDLPTTVTLVYFLISWSETFPTLAYTALLNDELQLSLSTITTFYAVTYMPFMWKPAFGWISDHFPIWGYRRIPYIIVMSLGSATANIVLACFVSSAQALFVVVFCRAICDSFLQLIVGAFLVDVARSDLSKSAKLQALANAAKWAGSLVATLMALACYSPGSGRAGLGAATSWARPAIAATAAAPALICILAPFLPEKRVLTDTAGRHAVSRESKIFFSVVAIAQLNFIIISCQTFLNFSAWLVLISIAGFISVPAIVVLMCCGRSGVVNSEQQQYKYRWAGICIVCFIMSALPSSAVAVGQLQYAQFDVTSYQILNIIGSVANLCASCAFARFGGWNLRRMFIASTLLAVAVGLTPLGFAEATGDSVKAHTSLLSEVGAWSIGAAVLGGFGSIFAILPIDTLATYSSGCVSASRSSTSYAILLSFQSFGGTAGGLVTAPVLHALGLDGVHWHALATWIIITALLRLTALPLVLLLLVLPEPATRGAALVTDSANTLPVDQRCLR
eukprot:TRINITY_DN14129_c0_g1_i2.p1 TRINITY_DN14129_c0_g1~~TRINITY_DN14129_c0_g1_i2.p1  ORF type:complete len:524 (-),score=54.18 TRINITY_DN14129_c0_g1_i2:188-1759(-)